MSTATTPATVPASRPLPWWVQFSINQGLVAIRQVLHNPAQAGAMKEIFLDLFNAIKVTYADDPDFK